MMAESTGTTGSSGSVNSSSTYSSLGSQSSSTNTPDQWFTDSAAVVNDIISTYYQVIASSNAQKQALALAEKQRKDLLAQKAVENKMSQAALELKQNQFSWDKMTWGKQWKMTKQQYLDQRNAAMAEMQRTGMLDALGGYNSQLQNAASIRSQAVGQMGV